MLADGHKLKVHKVGWVGEHLVHRTDGPLPTIGARAQLHLDGDRRARNARAHAALHLLITAAAESYATFTDDPCVVGGAEARLVAKFREDPKVVLPKVLARAQQLAAAREDVVAKWAPREDVAKMASHEPVPLRDIMPGEPTLRVVQCGKRSLLPCDAPLVEHTWQVGKMELALVQRKSDAVRFGVKATTSA